MWSFCSILSVFVSGNPHLGLEYLILNDSEILMGCGCLKLVDYQEVWLWDWIARANHALFEFVLFRCMHCSFFWRVALVLRP